MFCTICGKELEPNENFCINCGEIRKTLNEEYKLESSSWLRLLKVSYVVLCGMAVIGVIVGIYGSKPASSIDQDASSILCRNGKNYPLSRNNISAYYESLSFYEDEHARILCEYDTLNFYGHINEKIPKNYTFKPVYEKVDYTGWLLVSVFAILLAWLILKLLKVGVLYVVLGKKPQWKTEVKKLF